MYGTLAELKTALGITDATRDTALTSELNTASEMIDNMCGRGAGAFNAAGALSTRLVRTQGNTYVGDYGSELVIPGVGDATGMIIEVGDGTSFATFGGAYGTGPDNALALGQPITVLRSPYTSWSAYTYTRVTARFGWPGGVTPYSVTKAALLLANRMYRRKDSPEGVIGSAEWGGIRVSRTDPDVAALLSTYMLPGFA